MIRPRHFPVWSANKAQDIEAIRAAALRTLERVGARVCSAEARRLLQEAGAVVEGERVRLPPQVVVAALEQAPRVVSFYSRDGGALVSQAGSFFHSPAPSAVAVLEPGGGRRASTYRDVADLTRMHDALPGIDFISPPAIAQDCPPDQTGLLTAEATFCNTQKFCLAFALNWGEARAWLAMAEAACGSPQALADRPVIGFAISPVSPLVLPEETAAILVGAARAGVPVVTVPGGMAGATSPYTLAGTLVVEHAEALLAAVIAQLARPGVPVVLGLATAVMDMGSGGVSLGAPERALILNAAAPLAHAWGLPGYAPAGLTDSFLLDAQAGGEKMLSFVSQLQSGLEFGAGVGRYEGGLSTSYAGVVLDHELLQAARRHALGVRVDADTLAEDVIATAGPGGDFLACEHTLRFLRSDEFWRFPSLNRRAVASRGQPSEELSRRRVEKLLAGHLSPVPEEQQAEFRRIVAGLAA